MINRPPMPQPVASAMTAPAPRGPRSGAINEKSWAISPIWAKRPIDIAAASVRNRRSRQSAGWGAAAGARQAPASAGWSALVGVRASSRVAMDITTATMASPTIMAAAGKPTRSIRTAHSGENTMPPTLAPL